ncbi:GntR family transcriptional regulator [Peloplasma aerotolerans]|jgi:GntR family transcriptional regulator|uniref:GntR family transcriptional regulator n=1 Tax=Peloplasma aerotolerans TaxID=3044389 RepID=A0AAW6UC99_9MOLU|nr:GntR family transcriptional regulator [Mariniplasma sp. M4Ah]MDI6453121.1 GntR family transcriptional regulator [Mariniplasma sp. M4Ah]
MSIDLADKMPFYLQVRNSLRQKIETGEWNEGDLIPSEKELAQHYGVSRVTIRTAISKLVQEQYLTRRAGFGTTVYKNKSSLSNFTMIRSFTNEMNEMGLPSKTMESELKEIEADKLLASIFNINEGDMLYNLRRVRGTVIPILYSDTYLLPVVKLPNTESFLMGSLYKYLSSQNIFFNVFEEYVSAVLAPKTIRNILQIQDDSPQLKRKRYSYDESNRLIEYTETFYNAAHYEYRTRLYYRKK